jgi:hypothetical protein
MLLLLFKKTVSTKPASRRVLLGARPQKNSTLNHFLLFPEKEAKSVSSASQKASFLVN